MLKLHRFSSVLISFAITGLMLAGSVAEASGFPLLRRLVGSALGTAVTEKSPSATFFLQRVLGRPIQRAAGAGGRYTISPAEVAEWRGLVDSGRVPPAIAHQAEIAYLRIEFYSRMLKAASSEQNWKPMLEALAEREFGRLNIRLTLTERNKGYQANRARFLAEEKRLVDGGDTRMMEIVSEYEKYWVASTSKIPDRLDLTSLVNEFRALNGNERALHHFTWQANGRGGWVGTTPAQTTNRAAKSGRWEVAISRSDNAPNGEIAINIYHPNHEVAHEFSSKVRFAEDEIRRLLGNADFAIETDLTLLPSIATTPYRAITTIRGLPLATRAQQKESTLFMEYARIADSF